MMRCSRFDNSYTGGVKHHGNDSDGTLEHEE